MATKIDEVIALLDSAKEDLVNSMKNVRAAQITGMTVQVGAERLGIDMAKIEEAANHTLQLLGEFPNLEVHIDKDKALWEAAKASKW